MGDRYNSLLFVLGLAGLMALAAGCDGDDASSDNRVDSGIAPEETSTPLCAGVSCWNPPERTCVEGDCLKVYNAVGWCETGNCLYADRREDCEKGLCKDGVCTETPCQGVSCHQPPENRCADEMTLVVYSPVGYCASPAGLPECRYANKGMTCEQGCKDGRCIEEPCAHVICNKPPAKYCNGDALVVRDNFGHCTNGSCEYMDHTVSCGGSSCEEGHCANKDSCSEVTCNVQPPSYCTNGNTLRVFNSQGACKDGACLYPGSEITCTNGCLDGQCTGEECAGVICDQPPAMYCKDETTLVSWDGETGTCEQGVCAYGVEMTTCSTGCLAGRCQGEPCKGVLCKTPPGSHCTDEQTLLEYESPGACNQGACNYISQRSTCEEACRDGACSSGGDADADTDTDTDTDTCIDGDTSSGSAGIVWVTICGGSFQMGSNDGDADETPVHGVTVPTFEMTKTEVTVSQYGECVTAGVCTAPNSGGSCNWGESGYENHPVNCVDWYWSVDFCTWVGGRLPSESEWEYAASNGASENTYPWGEATASCSYAVMDDGGMGCGTSGTMAVCSKTAGNTTHGLCDMAGNVREWVEDYYHGSYDCDANPSAENCSSGGLAPSDGSAWTSGSDEYRVLRGGSWRGDDPVYFRAAARGRYNPAVGADSYGFRCVRSSH